MRFKAEPNLRSITWDHCGITRNEESLAIAGEILRSALVAVHSELQPPLL